MNALHDSQITFSLHKHGSGINRLQKPDKLYLDNTNLSYALVGEASNRGTARETFTPIDQSRHAAHVAKSQKAIDITPNLIYTMEDSIT